MYDCNFLKSYMKLLIILWPNVNKLTNQNIFVMNRKLKDERTPAVITRIQLTQLYSSYLWWNQGLASWIFGKTLGLFWRDTLKVAKNFLGPEMPLSVFWGDTFRESEESARLPGSQELSGLSVWAPK